MKRRQVFLFTSVLIGAVAGPTTWAAAESINLATGLNSSGQLITTGGVNDANWTVTPDPTYSPTGIPQTVFPNNADWSYVWVPNGPNSDWIARNANATNNGPAPYTFYRTFTLAENQLSSASITGAWTVDDAGTLTLNGQTVASLDVGSWGSLWSFSVPTGSSDFVAGTNTLAITITFDDEHLDGARLQGFLTAAAAVPEPSTTVLGATALLIGSGLAWRRRRSSLASRG